MNVIQQDLERQITASISAFEQEVIPMLQGRLQATDQQATRHLAESLRMAVRSDAEKMMAYLTLTYAGYGKAVESKKSLVHTTPLDDLVQWIKDRGLAQFRYVPGYEGRSIPTIDQSAKRMAYFMLSRQKQQRSTYAGSWLFRPFFGLWAGYRDKIVEAYITASTAHLEEQLTSALTMNARGKGISLKPI